MKPLIEHEPRPKPSPRKTPPIAWPVLRALKCPPVVAPQPTMFDDVLESRRSLRSIAPAPIREIINVVAYATRPRFVLASDELSRTRRPSPSAGALHPIDIALVDWRTAPRVMRYSSLDHDLQVLLVESPGKLAEFLKDIQTIVPEVRGTALVLLGDRERVGAVYEESISLLWRDAGALLQTLFLAATAYRLSFCPIGLLGNGLAEALGLQGSLVATGTVVIGRDPNSNL